MARPVDSGLTRQLRRRPSLHRLQQAVQRNRRLISGRSPRQCILILSQNVLNGVKIQLHVTNSAVRIHAITGAGAPVQAVGPHLREKCND
jgi:hypothetical protein